jgi:hypothetical protein
MSTKTTIAAIATFMAVMAAPQLASAQQEMFLPSVQQNWDHATTGPRFGIPSDARGQAGVRHSRAASPAYGWTDSDANIWLQERRDPSNDR